MTIEHQTARIYAELSDIMQHNTEAEGHWFDRSATEFFQTNYYEGVWGEYGEVFITSEQRFDTERAWTVRAIHPITGRIHTLGEFMQWETQADAERQADSFAKKFEKEQGL